MNTGSSKYLFFHKKVVIESVKEMLIGRRYFIFRKSQNKIEIIGNIYPSIVFVALQYLNSRQRIVFQQRAAPFGLSDMKELQVLYVENKLANSTIFGSTDGIFNRNEIIYIVVFKEKIRAKVAGLLDFVALLNEQIENEDLPNRKCKKVNRERTNTDGFFILLEKNRERRYIRKEKCRVVVEIYTENRDKKFSKIKNKRIRNEKNICGIDLLIKLDKKVKTKKLGERFKLNLDNDKKRKTVNLLMSLFSEGIKIYKNNLKGHIHKNRIFNRIREDPNPILRKVC